MLTQQKKEQVSIQQILSTEYSEQFDKIRKNMMATSFYKYGKASLNYPTRIDAMASLKKRIDMYEQTGNKEYLADIANFAMLEFMFPRKENAYYKPTDSDGSCGVVGLGIAEEVD